MAQPANRRLATEQYVADTAATLVTRGNLPVNVLDFGVSPSRTAAQNAAALQAAITAAGAAGRDVYVPAMSGTVQINATAVISTAGQRFVGAGRGSHIQQTTVGQPVIALAADNTAVERLQVSNATRSVASVTNDATDLQPDESQLSMGHCGIQVRRGTTGCQVRNIYGHTVHAVVTALAYGPSSPLIYSLRVADIECADTAFAVKVRGLVDPTVTGIRGTYDLTPGIGHPPHAVYFSGMTDVPNSTNILVDGVQAWSGTIGDAVKIASTDSGTVTHIVARGCRGVVDVLDSSDVTITNVVGVADANDQTYPGSVKATVHLDNSSRITVRGVNVQHAANITPTRALQVVSNCTDCTVENATFTINYPTADNAADSDSVLVQGTRTTLRNVTVRNIGALRGTAFRIDTTGSAVVINPKVVGEYKYAVYLKTGSQTLLEYRPDDIPVSQTEANSTPILFGTAVTPTLRVPPSAAAELDRPLAWFGNTRTPGTDLNASYWSSGHLATRNQTWVWSGNEIQQSGNNSNAATWINPGVANIEIETRILFGGTRAGVALKLIDANNYLICSLQATGVVIGERLSAGVTDLVTYARTLTAGRAYTLRVVCFGSVVEAYLDGDLVLTYTLTGPQQTTYGASTLFGLHAATAAAARFRWGKMRAV